MIKVQYSERNGETIVAFNGQLNFAANEEIQRVIEKLSDQKNRNVEFDLDGVSHIDSVGLGMLYIAQEELSARGSKLRLVRPRDGVNRLLQLTDAYRTFEIVG
ncbi:Anti-anti-sigma regulatory factor [Candidatus Terasakiella magnetica]|nr:Anti-anti-sigma regulatory factor [Candidatus Terasakiella magnetica]